MARGSVIKRCPVCRKLGLKGQPNCNHKEATYSIVYRVGKKQVWETVGPNKKQAERKLLDYVSDINGGTYLKPVGIAFEDFAIKWLEDYARISVKPSTYQTYRMAISCHFNPFFGSLPLLYITAEKIQNFVSSTLKKCSPKTVNNLVVQLKTMFKYAKRWGYIKENPASDIDHVRVEYREMDYLNPDEIKLLLKHAQEPCKTLFLTAVMTGARRGELLALQWGDIDWHNNTIFIKRSIYWHAKKYHTETDKEKRWQFISPKSKKSIRAIVMSPMLKEALEIHRINCPVSAYDLVFCNSKGNPMDPDNMVKRDFLPTLTVAGLRKVCFHSLRHGYTALLIAQNANIKFIQSQLGHASIQTTLDRYGHLLPSTQQDVGVRIDQQLFGCANTVLTKHPATARNSIEQEQRENAVTLNRI
jgi:integrase